MAATFEIRTAFAELLAADTSRTIIAAPASNERIRIFRVLLISYTSAAQALTIAAGTTTILKLAASVTAHTPVDTGWLSGGLVGEAGRALIITPASAGPAATIYVDYAIE